jgi:hypothetical protein
VDLELNRPCRNRTLECSRIVITRDRAAIFCPEGQPDASVGAGQRRLDLYACHPGWDHARHRPRQRPNRQGRTIPPGHAVGASHLGGRAPHDFTKIIDRGNSALNQSRSIREILAMAVEHQRLPEEGPQHQIITRRRYVLPPDDWQTSPDEVRRQPSGNLTLVWRLKPPGVSAIDHQ